MNVQSKQSIAYTLTGAGIGLVVTLSGLIVSAFSWLQSVHF